MARKSVPCLLPSSLLMMSVMILTTMMAYVYRASDVNANGFTEPIAIGDAGPYEYLVGIWPPESEVEVGELFMSITLTAENRTVTVTDAAVEVVGSLDGGLDTVGPLSATNSIQHFNSYELYVTLETPGRWVFQIDIESPLGPGVVVVSLEIAGDAGDEEETSPKKTERATQGAPSGGSGLELASPVPEPRIEAFPTAIRTAYPGRGIREAQDTEKADGLSSTSTSIGWIVILAPIVVLAIGLAALWLRRLM